MRKSIYSLLLAVLTLSACKKSSEGTANVRVINLVPNSTSLDFNVNGSLQVGSIGYGVATAYQGIGSNSPSFTIGQSGTILFSSALGVSANSFYTLYLYDSTTSMKVSFLQDDRTAPPSGKANIRFLHFYKGNVIVDIRQGTSTNMFTNRSATDHFNNSSLLGYTTFDPGTFNVTVYVAGTSVQLFQFPNFTAEAGKSYTFVLRGFSNVTSGPQALQLIPITD
ncbi:MAG: DUF4397 domain-containing protein [Chitinophagaceae bacterium]|nr:DUF4397 domain-containing protein [Chitinophagaceae bacterium]